MSDMNLFGRKERSEREECTVESADVNTDSVMNGMNLFGSLENELEELEESNEFENSHPAKSVQMTDVFQKPTQTEPVYVKQSEPDKSVQNKTKKKTSVVKEGNSVERVGTMIFTEPSVSAAALDYAKFFTLKTKFERGRTVLAYQQCGEECKPLMCLLKVGQELMAYRYLGSDLEVRIPAFVGGLPVKYLHSEFLTGGVTPFSGIKFKAIQDSFSVDRISETNRESLSKAMKGACKLILPRTLTTLPPNIFYKCISLKELVIPSSVTAVSTRTFAYSCFSDLWFEGKCPQGFLGNTCLPTGVKVHFRPEFSASFGEIGGVS